MLLLGVGGMLALLMAPGAYKPMVLATGFAIGGFLWLRHRGIWRRLVIAWLLRAGRLGRHAAQTFRTNVLEETLWLVTFVGALTWFATAGNHPTFAGLAALFALYTLALGGAIYWGSVGLRLGQRAWVRAVGKIGIGVAVAGLVCVSRSAASDFVTSAVHVAPESFPLFLNLATTIMTPCLGIVGMAALALLLALSMFVVVLVAKVTLGQSLRRLRNIRGLRFQRHRHFTFVPMPPGTRTVSGFFVAALIFGAPFDILRAHRDLLTNCATNLLVYTDFRPGVACDGIAIGERIAFTGEGQVVVARRMDNDRWAFGEQPCRVDRDSPAFKGLQPVQ